MPAKCDEMLHNIDPKGEIESFALRQGDYKVIFCGTAWDGWYAPEGVDLGGEDCHVFLCNDSFQQQ